LLCQKNRRDFFSNSFYRRASGPFATPFRNYPRLDADFVPGFHLLLGDNAQANTDFHETTPNRYLPIPARLC
jgi:hypothetical protein